MHSAKLVSALNQAGFRWNRTALTLTRHNLNSKRGTGSVQSLQPEDTKEDWSSRVRWKWAVPMAGMAGMLGEIG